MIPRLTTLSDIIRTGAERFEDRIALQPVSQGAKHLDVASRSARVHVSGALESRAARSQCASRSGPAAGRSSAARRAILA